MEANVWQNHIAYLKGVGPKKALVLEQEAGIQTFEDLAGYFPYRYVDRRTISFIEDLKTEGEQISLIGRLGRFQVVEGKRPRLVCNVYDMNNDAMELTWFQQIPWVKSKFKEKDIVVLFGRVTFFQQQPQMVHPEMELMNEDEQQLSNNLQILPFYHSSERMKRAQLDARGLRKTIRYLIDSYIDTLPEIYPQTLLAQENLMSRKEAIRQIHFPESFEHLNQAKKRLKFDELFFFQLLLARRRMGVNAAKMSRPFTVIGDYFNTFYHKYLPFELTGAQKRVIKEIRNDVARPVQMNRLVQGDVGSGKTMVALMSILMAVDNGFQSALMAPTEILAEQHFSNFYRLLSPLGLQVDLLSGSTKKKTRDRILADLQSGACHVLIGTHALIEDWVQFKNLGLTVIDEQHKFGVLQRSRLWSKSEMAPHNIAMSATPIPRTLAMTLYGDIDVSVINELPPGRKPIKTLAKTHAHRLEIFGFVKKELQKGRQAYFVYPLVEESAKSDLLACEQGYEDIQRAFPEFRVGIVNGKMKADAKDFEMQRFKKNETQILVSTTVIEVGVDVPNASIMVIENADRFGLSQLHQLRGRVGRGAEQSYNILVTQFPPKGDAKERLQAMCQTNDGFRIAEIDLKLRGPGDFLGTKQSGLPDFKIANLTTDGEILQTARVAANQLAKQDFHLKQPEHEELKNYYIRYINRFHLDELIA